MSRLALEKHCWAEIDLTALRSNFEYIHRAVGGDICAVVKADAYGHGDTTIAHALQQPVRRRLPSAAWVRDGTCAAAASQNRF